MQLVEGRPEDTTGRLDKEISVYDLLDKLNIDYQRIDHNPAKTVDDCVEIDQVLGMHICKNLFLCNKQKTKFYMLMMPGEKTFKTKELSSQIDTARLSFAKPEYMESFLDITPGSVSVMGLMNDVENKVQLLIDDDLLKDEYIACHPCINTSSLKIRTKDIVETFLKAVHHDMIPVKLTGIDE